MDKTHRLGRHVFERARDRASRSTGKPHGRLYDHSSLHISAQEVYTTYEIRPQDAMRYDFAEHGSANRTTPTRHPHSPTSHHHHGEPGRERKRYVVEDDRETYDGYRVREVYPDEGAGNYNQPSQRHRRPSTSFSRTTYHYYESNPPSRAYPDGRWHSEPNDHDHRRFPTAFRPSTEQHKHKRGFRYVDPDAVDDSGRFGSSKPRRHEDEGSRRTSSEYEGFTHRPRVSQNRSDNHQHRERTMPRRDSFDSADFHNDRRSARGDGPSDARKGHSNRGSSSHWDERQSSQHSIPRASSPVADHYCTLGVHKTASPAEIKKAYRALALKWHPDRNRSPEADERFKSINEAHEILVDEVSRRHYDRQCQ